MTPDLERRIREHYRKEIEALAYSVKVYRGLADEYERKLTEAERRLSEYEQKRSDDL